MSYPHGAPLYIFLLLLFFFYAYFFAVESEHSLILCSPLVLLLYLSKYFFPYTLFYFFFSLPSLHVTFPRAKKYESGKRCPQVKAGKRENKLFPSLKLLTSGCFWIVDRFPRFSLPSSSISSPFHSSLEIFSSLVMLQSQRDIDLYF